MKLYTEEKICDFCESQLKNPYKPINTKRSILTYICDNLQNSETYIIKIDTKNVILVQEDNN